ncbi:DUF2384 domain-containing protein [Vibrio cholerae]|uniref:MbcA/ParS/Xre antitoxin family protein n=1 Tax=Vibrio cholerae TaxID=666 RepID=UPI0011D91F94|nr:MbcA/ParS/Xre antitoxin family protein [Vibrio cholerae]TXY78129.1 DUF2384 domain-containing protein [Vibrio cholerae]GIB17400.1 hypothetical protein VCSRO90_2977 [Vibrio cholerae]
MSVSLDEIVLSRLSPDFEVHNTSALEEAMLDEPRLRGQTLRVVTQNISRDVVAKAIDVDRTNLSKLYSRKLLSRVQSEDISDLTLLWAEMRDVFDNNDAQLKEWLNASLPALNGRAPVDFMHSLAGRKALRDILNRLTYGDFS